MKKKKIFKKHETEISLKKLLTFVHLGTCRSRNHSQLVVRNTNILHKNVPLLPQEYEHWSANTPRRLEGRCTPSRLYKKWNTYIWMRIHMGIRFAIADIFVVLQQNMYYNKNASKCFSLNNFRLFSHSLSVLIVEAQELERTVLLQRPVQVPQLTIYSRDDSIVGKALAERKTWNLYQKCHILITFRRGFNYSNGNKKVNKSWIIHYSH